MCDVRALFPVYNVAWYIFFRDATTTNCPKKSGIFSIHFSEQIVRPLLRHIRISRRCCKQSRVFLLFKCKTLTKNVRTAVIQPSGIVRTTHINTHKNRKPTYENQRLLGTQRRRMTIRKYFGWAFIVFAKSYGQNTLSVQIQERRKRMELLVHHRQRHSVGMMEIKKKKKEQQHRIRFYLSDFLLLLGK